tara:strand:+ start:351 stop:500 length:150 start_codon:yes stop_codon:yes gene_type:complete
MLKGDTYILQGNREKARDYYKMAIKHPWFISQALKQINFLNRESITHSR